MILCASSTAAINVTKVIVDISPSDEDVIPLVLNLQDDSIVEPTDFYQLTIVNVSDPNVVMGEKNTSFIIVSDDDDGKICMYEQKCVGFDKLPYSNMSIISHQMCKAIHKIKAIH